MTACNVCDADLGDPVYASGQPLSLTTMNAFIEGETKVYFCATCGHAQTPELPDLERFYAEDYAINAEGAEDDQLYEVRDGREIYRSEHQATVLADKIDLAVNRRVLDYGCAGAQTLRKLRAATPEMEAYLFDVTDKYVEAWRDFPEPRAWATHRTDPDWQGRMDVVLSFYALEHIPHLGDILGEVRDLLRDGGTFYFLVPNLYRNAADFIVADHVNHFSTSSLTVLLERHGFTGIDIDTEAHHAAFVVSAQVDKARPCPAPATSQDTTRTRIEIDRLAAFWGGMRDRVQSFEAGLRPGTPVVIYGAGIYGNYLYACLRHPDRVTHFLDRNAHLDGREINGLPVIAPDALPHDRAAMLVGLNPRIARDVIAGMDVFAGRDMTFFFPD